MKVIAAPPVPYEVSKLNAYGFGVLFFALLGFVLWTVLTPIDSAVVAQGSIQVLSQNKQVQHLEGGIVESIKVAENQLVAAGDVLLTLDETFAGAEHQRLKVQEGELNMRRAMLIAERDIADTIVFPSLENGGIQSDWLLAKKTSTQQLFDLTRGNLNSQLEISDKKRVQLNEQGRGLDLEHAAKLQQLGYMEEEVAAWKPMVEKKLANKLRFLEIQSDAADLRGVLAKISAQKAEIDVKLSEVELEQVSMKQAYQERAARELRDVEFSIKDIQERLDTATNVLGRITIKAPVDGRIVGLNVHTIGAVIKPGEVIMEIVPDKESLIVETRIDPTDVDQVYPGMIARIRMASYKRHEFPELQGKVASVSADVFEEQHGNERYYLARISISGAVLPGAESIVHKAAELSAIQPGMPAEVMIITGTSTPAQYLMDPLLNNFNRAWRDK